MSEEPKPKKVSEKNETSWRTWLFIAVAVAMIAATPFLIWMQRSTQSAVAMIDERISVRVEVADTDYTRERGLSGHAPLAADEGMFFIFNTASRNAFWMKEMLFPLDIIWIRENEIVDITTDVPPPTDFSQPLPLYRPMVPADKVLEVQAGFAKEHGLRLGMPVELRY
jgi:uncharacterized membrane protein (UPF0127 family)